MNRPRHGDLAGSIRTRPLLYVVGAVLFIPLALSLSAIVVSRTDWFHRYVSQRIQRQVSASIAGNLTIDQLRLTSLSGVEAEGLCITASQGDTVIWIDRVSARIGLLPILIRKVLVTDLFVRRGLVVLDMDKKQNLTNVFLPTSRGPGDGRPVSVWIDPILLEGIDFLYRDSTVGVQVDLRSLSARGALKRTSTVVAGFSGDSGLIRVGEQIQHLQGLSISALVTDSCLSMDTLMLGLREGLQLALSGRIPYRSQGLWEANLEARADRQFAELLSSRSFSAGSRIRTKATLKGRIVSPDFRFQGWAEQARYRNVGIDSIAVDLDHESSGRTTARFGFGSPIIWGEADASADIPQPFRNPWKARYQASGSVFTPDFPGVLNRLQLSSPTGAVAACRARFFAEGDSLNDLPDSATVSAVMTQVADSHGQPLPPFSLTGRITSNVLAFKARWDRMLSLDGTGSVVGKGFSANAGLTVDNPRGLSSLAFAENIDGTIRGSVHMNNANGPLYVNALFSARDLAWGGLRCDTAHVDLQHSEGQTDLLAATARVTASLDSLPARLGMPRMEGRVAAQVTAGGRLPVPEVDALVAVTGFEVGRFCFDTLQAHARLAKDMVDITGLTARTSGSTISGETYYHLKTSRAKSDLRLSQPDDLSPSPPGTISAEGIVSADSITYLDLALDGVPLAALESWLSEVDLPSGTVSLQARASGKHSNPAVDAELSVAGLSVKEEGINAEVHAYLGLKDSTVTAVCTLSAYALCAPLMATATASLRPSEGFGLDTLTPLTITVRGNNACLAPLGPILGDSLIIAGSLDADVRVDYDGRNWLPRGSVRITDGSLSYSPASLSATGITLTVDPPDSTYSSVKAKFELRTGIIDLPKADFVGLYATGGITPRLVTLDSAELRHELGQVSARGSVPIAQALSTHPDFGLSLKASRFPFAALNTFVEEGEFQGGYMSAEMELGPGDGAPTVVGTAAGDSVVFAMAELQPAIGPLSFVARVDGRRVTLEALDGKWGEGSVHGDGQAVVSASGIDSASVQLSARGCQLRYGEEIMLTIDSARATYTLIDTSSVLRAAAYVGESVVEHEVLLLQALATSEPQRSETHSSMGLDLTLNAPNTILGDVTITQGFVGPASRITALLGGTIKVGGSVRRPTYSGEVAIADGTATYLDRTFTIVQGHARQPTGNEINPFVSVVAEAEVREAQGGGLSDPLLVTLRISGDLNDLSVSLSSSSGPRGRPYRQEELASLLTFGAAEVRPSDARTMLRDRGSSVVSQSVSVYASRYAQSLLGLDQVSVQGNLLDFNSEGNTDLTVSKRFGKNVRLTYKGTLGNPEQQEALLSWRLLPFLFLEGEGDVVGNAAVDMRLRFQR